MERLQTFMQERRIPRSLRVRVREFMYNQLFVGQAEEAYLTTNMLTPTLQSDLVHASTSYQWLWNAFLLRDCHVEFIVLLPTNMVPRVYAPYELPERSRFYVLSRGVALIGGRLLTSN
eukprot:7391173-Prymnesium_polylepis.1